MLRILKVILSFECEEQNKNIKARVCGGDLEVHFSEQKIIMGKFDQSGCLTWGQVFDSNGTWPSTAWPWQRL